LEKIYFLGTVRIRLILADTRLQSGSSHSQNHSNILEKSYFGHQIDQSALKLKPSWRRKQE
jgi:hypothetical protein